jgi:PAS domain S-box-containing protein
MDAGECGKIGDLSDEQRFQLLVTGIRDYAIYLLNPEGFINSWNAGAERFKGYAAHEIIGQHFSVFYTEEDRLAGKPTRALQIAREQGKFEDEGWRVRSDGTRFWASVVVDPIRDRSGELIGFCWRSCRAAWIYLPRERRIMPTTRCWTRCAVPSSAARS